MDLSFLTQLIGSRQGSPRPSHDVLVRNAVAAFSAPPPPPPPPLPREPSPENAGLEQEKNAQEDGDEVMEDAEDAVDNMQGRVQGFHYWWLSSLNDELWQQLVQRHGGFVDESTGTRRTHREIPPGVRRAYMARVQQAAQEESDSETGGGVSNMYVVITSMSPLLLFSILFFVFFPTLSSPNFLLRCDSGFAFTTSSPFCGF